MCVFFRFFSNFTIMFVKIDEFILIPITSELIESIRTWLNAEIAAIRSTLKYSNKLLSCVCAYLFYAQFKWNPKGNENEFIAFNWKFWSTEFDVKNEKMSNYLFRVIVCFISFNFLNWIGMFALFEHIYLLQRKTNQFRFRQNMLKLILPFFLIQFKFWKKNSIKYPSNHEESCINFSKGLTLLD